MKGNFKATSALTLVSDPQFSTAVEKLPMLQKLVIDQLAAVARMERDAALHAIVIGLTLYRIKASLPYGQFGKWISKHLEPKKSQVNNYMRLATAFLENSGVSKPDLLALPGDSAKMILTGDGPAKRLFKKAVEFVGDKSLNELLIEHAIKSAGTGSGSGAPAAVPPGGEDPLWADTAEHLMGLRTLLLDPETMKRFTATQLNDIETQWASGLDQFRKLKAQLRA
jgi:Protein of unknown function (DUF3102)